MKESLRPAGILGVLVGWDARLFRLVNGWAGRPWLDRFMVAVATYAPVAFVAALAVQWLLPGGDRRSRRRRVALAVAAALVALGAAHVIGVVHFRPRPFTTLPGVRLLVARTPDPSFPSDHATATAALAYFLGLAGRRWALGSWAAVALLAFARVFVGTHYPADVLGGVALGLLAACGLHRLEGRLSPVLDRLVDWVEAIPVLGRW